jgi:hypothetical protein
MNASGSSTVRFVLFAAGVSAIGGFLFGYDTAVINGANAFLKALMNACTFVSSSRATEFQYEPTHQSPS